MSDKTETVRAKKADLDALRQRVAPGALDALEHTHRIDITYTSNAVEGNTLTAGETALVLEKGLTVSGKPLKDHLEAIDHAKALDWVLDIASPSEPIAEVDIRNLHRLVVAQSDSDIAGRYADRARLVNTDAGLFEAHRRLVGIHPFNDRNGCTARLLMNLILTRAGYPPIAIRPEDRPAYIAALEASRRWGADAFDALLLGRLDRTLDLYISAAREAQSGSKPKLPMGT